MKTKLTIAIIFILNTFVTSQSVDVVKEMYYTLQQLEQQLDTNYNSIISNSDLSQQHIELFKNTHQCWLEYVEAEVFFRIQGKNNEKEICKLSFLIETYRKRVSYYNYLANEYDQDHVCIDE